MTIDDTDNRFAPPPRVGFPVRLEAPNGIVRLTCRLRRSRIQLKATLPAGRLFPRDTETLSLLFALKPVPVMSFVRNRISAVIAWGMILLAVLAGAPSTGCFCASGQFKLLCAHAQYGAGGLHADHGILAHDCCAAHVADGECELCAAGVHSCGEHEGDCCGHGDASPGDGVRSRSCCQPVLNALSMGSAPVSAPADDAPAAVADGVEPPAVAHSSHTVDRVDFDTGPPLDRVVVFRHLLI